jgi:hypothetical protein
VSAQSLRAALRAAGFECAVEAHDGVALLIPQGDPSSFAGARRNALGLARSHGFTHVAVELVRRDSSAAFPGD